MEGRDTTQVVVAPLGHVPLYVQGGGILVTQQPHANTMLSRCKERERKIGLTIRKDITVAFIVLWII